MKLNDIDFEIIKSDNNTIELMGRGIINYMNFNHLYENYVLLDIPDKGKFFISERRLVDEFLEVFTMTIRRFDP